MKTIWIIEIKHPGARWQIAADSVWTTFKAAKQSVKNRQLLDLPFNYRISKFIKA